MTIRTPICDMLGIAHPILLAGMGGVSYAELCAAVSEAGGFGTLGMAGRSPTEIRDQMRRVRALTKKPFGVDLLAACTVARISLDRIVTHLLPFVLVVLACLLVITYGQAAAHECAIRSPHPPASTHCAGT